MYLLIVPDRPDKYKMLAIGKLDEAIYNNFLYHGLISFYKSKTILKNKAFFLKKVTLALGLRLAGRGLHRAWMTGCVCSLGDH